MIGVTVTMDKGRVLVFNVECSLIVSSSKNEDRIAIDFMPPGIETN